MLFFKYQKPASYLLIQSFLERRTFIIFDRQNLFSSRPSSTIVNLIILLNIMKAFLSVASVHLRWPAWPTSQAWASCSWECSPGWTGLWRFKSNFEDKGSTILSLSLTHHYLLSSASISALYIYQTWLLRFIFSIKTCWDCFFLEKSRLEIIPDFHDWLRSWSRLKWLLVRSTIVKTTSFHKFANAVVCLPSWMQILFRADQSEASDDQ